VDPTTSDLPAERAARLRRPGWRDPRLLVGLALVAASVALGSWVVRTAQDTVAVYVVRQTTVPGDRLVSSDLSVAHVRLGEVGLDGYLPADEPLPDEAVALRVVEAGELLPRSAVGSAADLALRPVAVPVRGVPSEAVRPGALVDLWFTAASGIGDDATAPDPAQLAAGLTVAEVARPQGALASTGTTTVQVLVPVDDLPDVLAALAADGTVDVVAVPGSGS